MNLGSLLKRSLAILLVLASVIGMVPFVMAEEGDPVENMLVAEFNENGELVYSPASEQIKSVTRAAPKTTQATSVFSKNATQRVAFFIDAAKTENGATGNNGFTISNANIDNLVNLGVTDFFVMVKDRSGGWNITNLQNVIKHASTSVNVFAWMHCALDNVYIKANPGSAQYHFRVGTKCNAYDSTDTSNYDTRNGYVNLRLDAYKTYFNEKVNEIETKCAGVDGILLDSVRFGADYYGWDNDARSKMGKDAFNEAVKKLAAHHGYTYQTVGGTGTYKDYYKYKGTTTADNTSLTTWVNGNSAYAQKYRNYRASVITGFIKSVRDNLASNLYLAVALESDWDGSNYLMSAYGQDPANFATHVSNGFCVVKSFLDVLQSYGSGMYGSLTEMSFGATVAKTVAKSCNVYIGIDGRWINHSSLTYVWYDPLYYQSYWIHNLRYTVNPDENYGGDVLGAAVYTAGNMGLQRITVDSISTTPDVTVDFVNGNYKTQSMLAYFHMYNDTDTQFNFSKTGISSGGVGTYNGGTQYFANKTKTGSYGYIGTYSTYTGAVVAAYGTGNIKLALQKFSLTYSTLPFARIGMYTTTASAATASSDYDYTKIAPMYPYYVVSGHTCSYGETVMVAPGCTSTGWSKYYCSTCKYGYIGEVKEKGHSYTAKVTAPTCTEQGYTTHTCSGCGDSYKDTYVAANGHSYVYTDIGSNHNVTCKNCTYSSIEAHTYDNGRCIYCGHIASKLLHFKAGSEEITWPWQVTGGSGLGFDTTGDGSMYATTNSNSKPYIDIDPSASSNIGHTIAAGDVIQIRLRVSNVTSNSTAAKPSISLKLEGNNAYGNEIYADAATLLDLTSTAWQVINIPVTSDYPVDEAIDKIRIYVYGDQRASADVEIDYIYFGTPDGTPVTATFYSYDGAVLQRSMVARGSVVEYRGPVPTRPKSAGFEYTFSGWNAQPANGTSSFVSNLATYGVSEDTVFTPQFTSEFTDVEPINSNKRLVDNDGDLEDYKYDIEIDASTYGQQVTINKVYTTPLDIVIVMDRSLSTTFHANDKNDLTYANANARAQLEKDLKDTTKLDPTKPEGYYTASNWLDCDYLSASDPYAAGYCSLEMMRYNSSKKQWEVWVTMNEADSKALATKITNNIKSYPDFENKVFDQWTFRCPASVMYNIYNWQYHNDIAGEWMSVLDAFDIYIARRDAAYTAGHINTTTFPKSGAPYRIGVSRLGLMQESLNQFVDKIYSTTSNLPQGSYHRVSVVGYGYGAYLGGRTAEYSYLKRNEKGEYLNAAGTVVKTAAEAEEKSGSYTTQTKYDPGVTCSPVTLNSTTNVNKIHSVINKPFAFGSTYTDDGLKLAKEHITSMNPKARGAAGLVVLFTDGCPTYSANFIIETADAALEAANAIKADGVTKIYTVGFMAGLNAGTAPSAWSFTASEGTKANNFLHLVSSNYKNATSMSNHGTRSQDKDDEGNVINYYFSTTDGSELGAHMLDVYTKSITSTEVQTSITADVEIRDTVTREWNIPKDSKGNWDITVQRCNYIGDGEFSEPKNIDNTNNQVYTLDVTELETGETEVVVKWHSVPDSWLREDNLADSTGFMGYKLLVTIGIELDRDSTIGGNNIPTNTDTSGVFYPTNPDLNHYYEVPNVNVEIEYDYQIHDFFMDLNNTNTSIDLLRALNVNDSKTNNAMVFGNMYSITTDVDGLNNRFVSISHSLNECIFERYIDQDGDEQLRITLGDPYQKQTLAKGVSTWNVSSITKAFDFTKDSSLLSAIYTVTPATCDVDSLGRAPFDPVTSNVQDGQVNYYAPKFAVVDFGTNVEVPLVDEAHLNMVRYHSLLSLSDDTKSLCYNFNDGTDMLNAMGNYAYYVTAINTPKGASDNTVGRTLTILPANNVMYEEGYLTSDGSWDRPKDIPERTQNCDNSEAHGYDSKLHLEGLNDLYSFGFAYETTVSAANNNKTLTFSFTGTGFDIISRTGPEDGVMVVEVYTDKAMTKKVKTALVNNYLKEDTLYQIPVVRYMDLDHGTYYVKIRAYYSDVFNPNYLTSSVSGAPAATRMALAQAQIRSALGLGANEAYDYFTASGAAITAKSGAETRTADTSYEVVVDGIRVYNPLGTISEEKDPEAYYIYGLANEINPTYLNARDLLLDATTWTYTGTSESATGLVYIAAKAASGDEDGNVGNTGTGSIVPGIHLNMDGKLSTKLIDGKEYLLDPLGNFVKVEGYTTNVYVVKSVTSTGRELCQYFCLDEKGKEVDVTGKVSILYYNSNYAVNGPKNEIYLADYNGVAFNVGSDVGKVEISAKSSNGKNVFLQVYSEKAGKFVNVYAHKISEDSTVNYSSNVTELYYDITDFVMANGDVVLCGPNGELDGVKQNGILSISGIKVFSASGATGDGSKSIKAPVETVMRGIELIQKDFLPEIIEDLPIGEQLYLESDLTMSFRLKESELEKYDIADIYMVVERDIYATDGSMSVSRTVLRDYKREGGRVIFTYSGISAAQMNDEIRVVVYIVDTNGKEYISLEKTTSVTTYAKTLLETLPTGQDKLYTVLMDMLNYGTAAQLYFKRHADAPANEAYEIFADYACYASTSLKTALENVSTQIPNEGATATISQALDLGTRIGITYKVNLPADVDAANAILVVKDADGKELETIDLSTGTVDNRGRYVVNFYGNASREMRRVVYATVYVDGVAISNTYTYSISSYAWSVYVQGSSAELIALTQAMIIYGDSAAAYFGK